MAEFIFVTRRKNYETDKRTLEQVKMELLSVGIKYNEQNGTPYFYTFLSENQDEINKIKESLSKLNYDFGFLALPAFLV
ncbi:MAG: hypothetical protein ACYCT7_03245 [bacterium]